jgi:hypothetical protein
VEKKKGRELWYRFRGSVVVQKIRTRGHSWAGVEERMHMRCDQRKFILRDNNLRAVTVIRLWCSE